VQLRPHVSSLFHSFFDCRRSSGQGLILSTSIYEMIRLHFARISVVEQICPCRAATGIMTVIVTLLRIGFSKKNMRLVIGQSVFFSFPGVFIAHFASSARMHVSLPLQLLDDFDDVSNLEKTFIKLWDAFIMSWSIIPDYSIPSSCLEFVRQNGITLIESNLRQKFLLHMFNLWDFRLVSSRHISMCMAELDSIAG
jgi:hypothetical protein